MHLSGRKCYQENIRIIKFSKFKMSLPSGKYDMQDRRTLKSHLVIESQLKLKLDIKSGGSWYFKKAIQSAIKK